MIYKNVNIPDEAIDILVDKLECSIEEACEAWLCDNGKATNVEQEEMTKKAQFAGVGKIVDADYKKGRKGPKKVPNEDKKIIIQELFYAVDTISESATIVNNEKYVDFVYHGENYTINLVKHRKK